MNAELIELNVAVERDKDGWWSNPGIPDFEEDNLRYAGWLKDQDIEYHYTMLEDEEESHPAYVAYYDDETASVALWNPDPPVGEGWHTFSIHDTEDGPVWCWARRVSPQSGAADPTDCEYCHGLGEVQGQGSYADFEPPIKKCSQCNGSGKSGAADTAGGEA